MQDTASRRCLSPMVTVSAQRIRRLYNMSLLITYHSGDLPYRGSNTSLMHVELKAVVCHTIHIDIGNLESLVVVK